MEALVDEVPAMSSGFATAGWDSFVKPLIHFGSFAAIG